MSDPIPDKPVDDVKPSIQKPKWGRIALMCGIVSLLVPPLTPMLLVSASSNPWWWKGWSFVFHPGVILPLLPFFILTHVAWFKIRWSGGTLANRIDALVGVLLVYLAFVLSLVAVSNFIKFSKHCMIGLSQYRQVDAAKDQYALENNITNNITPNWSDLTPYLKAGSRLALDGGRDSLGNPMLIGPIHDRLRVNPLTKEAVKDVVNDSYWGPYS